MDEATNQALEALRGQIYQISARRLPVREGLAAPAPPPVSGPQGWLVETLETQGVTAGSDWDTVFNNSSYARVYSGIPTVYGEIEAMQVANGNNRAARARLLFDSPNDFDFRILFTADDFGRLQYKINNSPYTELTAESLTTLHARRGRNVLQVSIGTQAGYCNNVQVRCRILNPRAGVLWIDPFSLDLEGYPPPGGGSTGPSPPDPVGGEA